MKMPDNIYEPEEDSQLMLNVANSEIKRYNLKFFEGKKICEVGVGSGYVLTSIAKRNPDNIFVGTDINSEAVEWTRDIFRRLKIKATIYEKDLLEDVRGKFDILIFNTPYLPLEKNEKFENLTIKDRAIYGGKNGYETIERFIEQINDSLEDNGFVLMLVSTHSKIDIINEILKKNLFKFRIVKEREAGMFETLMVYKIEKTEVLKKISKKVKNLKYFASGKHSITYTAISKKSTVLVKVGKPKDIEIESYYLKKLKDLDFVPKIFSKDPEFVIREFITGDLIEEFLKNANKSDIIFVLNKILEITYELDSRNINKLEMTNPYKHIFVKRNEKKELEVKMIDYERCIFTQKPKNTTQIFQYFRRHSQLLAQKGIILSNQKMFDISKTIKKQKIKVVLDDILE